jgi:anti-anti-sigma factor
MPSAHLRWPLTIVREDVDGIAVFVASGRLGTLTAGDLIEALAAAIQDGARRLVLDLSAVDYLSSAGLLALDAIQGRLHIVGGDMVLCGMTEPVRMAFDLSGLLPNFTEAPSRDDAMAKLAAPAVPSA